MAASGCGLPGLKRVILTTRSAPEIVTHIYSVLTSRHAIFSTRSFHPIAGKAPDQSLVVGLTLKVSGCGRFRPMDAVEYRQPQEHNAIADAIERSAKEPTNYFDFADDLGWL